MRLSASHGIMPPGVSSCAPRATTNNQGGIRMRPETENEALSRDNQGPDRRAVLAGIGVAAAAAAASAVPKAADAQPAVATETFWNQRYEAMKGNVKLQLYRRRLKAPVAGERPLPVLILVHGSSMSTMPTFDLTVPG